MNVFAHTPAKRNTVERKLRALACIFLSGCRPALAARACLKKRFEQGHRLYSCALQECLEFPLVRNHRSVPESRANWHRKCPFFLRSSVLQKQVLTTSHRQLRKPAAVVKANNACFAVPGNAWHLNPHNQMRGKSALPQAVKISIIVEQLLD